MIVHLSPLLYAQGKAVLYGREMWPNGAFDGHIIADRNTTQLLPGERFCEACLQKRKELDMILGNSLVTSSG